MLIGIMEKNMCKLSIIMPSLNVVKYISRCIESVISQSLMDIEVICVDAGSTDGTLEVLEEYEQKDSRIKIIHSDIKSYGYQMNLGISYASGEYIGIVETDDFVDDCMFEEMYAIADKYNVDFVKGTYKEFAEHSKLVVNQIHRIKLDNKYVNKKIYLKNNIEARFIDLVHIWSGIYSRDFLIKNNIKFNETEGASFQDTSFSILVGVLADTCFYTDKALYYYRIDNCTSSVKSNNKVNCIIDEFRFLDIVLKDKLENKDIKYRIDRAKLNAYKWNLSRLNDDSAQEFLCNIKKDMVKLKNDDIFCSWLNSIYLEYLENLLGRKNTNENEVFVKHVKNVNRLIYCLKTNYNVEIIGAGDYAYRILLLQQYMDTKNNINIYDNNDLKIGNSILGHTVKKVESIADFKCEIKYIIANRNNWEELYNQLLELNVSIENIIVCNNLPSWSEMISIYNTR